MTQRPVEAILNRVLLPVEARGLVVTRDREEYQRDRSGALRRVRPKARGKAARRAERQARRERKARDGRHLESGRGGSAEGTDGTGTRPTGGASGGRGA